MLAPGNYVQWKSIIKRYIDTKPNHKLIHFCLKNPPYIYKYKSPDADATPATPDSEAEAVQIILMGIDNDIYSTLYACPNAMEMWNDIERNDCTVTNHQVNVQFLLQLKPEWQRLARIANPLAHVAQQQPVYHPQSNTTHYNQSSSTKSQATPRNRGKAIANSHTPPPPPYVIEPDVDTNDESSLRDNDDEPDNQGLEAHYMYMAQIQEVSPDVAANSGPIFDSEPLQKVRECDDNYNVFTNDVFASESEHPKQPNSSD
ncbi:hypothetical protein Tco_0688012 [Tanacetum coccineum]